MKYRTLGRTGLEVSELIFGCGNVGGLLIRGAPDEMRAAVRRALDAGINWFDTAAAYGDGKSEESLGWLLEEVDESPYVSTKIRLESDRLDDIPGQIERSVENSLTRLRRDQVDLLQFHNPIATEAGGRAVPERDVLRDGGIVDCLERLRDKGMTRFIGLTALGETECCRRVIDGGRFDVAQIYYNMLNPSAGRAMPAGWTGQDFGSLITTCNARSMGVIAIRILAAGVLAAEDHGRVSILTSDTDVETEERKARAVFDALGSGCGTRAQAAIRFALSNPEVTAANIGLADLSQLDEALPAVDLGSLPADALERLDRLYGTDFKD